MLVDRLCCAWLGLSGYVMVSSAAIRAYVYAVRVISGYGHGMDAALAW